MKVGPSGDTVGIVFLSGLCFNRIRQLVDSDSRADVAGNVAKMLVVSEIDDLSYLGHVGEDTESFSCAQVVRGLENVVGDEGHRAVQVDELQIARYAQGEIELETCTFCKPPGWAAFSD